jgi:hypothetical protein
LFLHQGAPQPKFPKLKAFKATMMKIWKKNFVNCLRDIY